MTYNTKVKTKELAEKLLREECMMRKSEKTWSAQILNLTNYRNKYLETMRYFEWLKNKSLVNHKAVAKFARRIFEELGAKYSEFILKQKIEKSFFCKIGTMTMFPEQRLL